MNKSIILETDSYKVSHHKQYPGDTECLFSYFESRGGRFPNALFFGLQYLLDKHFEGAVVTCEGIDEAREMFALHFGSDALFNEAGWQYILNRHGGRLPIRIRAVAEGSVVPVGNALITMENTDPHVPWLVNYLETTLVRAWYPITVATQSATMRATIVRYLEETGDPNLIDFKLHDFGYRGSTSEESAAIGGAAHLVNFQGTDTFAAVRLLRQYYGAPMAGFSIPAAEHSTITSWGRSDEARAYANMLDQFPNGLVAVVSDSYDILNACRNIWGGTLRDQVLARDGTLVIRPDSGDPEKVVVEVLNILGEKFDFVINGKGYRVLDPHVRVIQGDGITADSIGGILEAMKNAGWSADNIAFGSGGGLLQKVDRDTMKFAFKASAIRRGGVWHDVMKDPATDPGKKSKAGRLMLVNTDGTCRTVREGTYPDSENLLVPVFEDGEILCRQTLAEIRSRSAA